MSIEFSEESLYVASHWQTVTELIEAAQLLRGEMGRMLATLEEDLRSVEWWSDGWVFVVKEPAQVCISRQAWKSGEQYLVWIGVDGFRPERVFGLDDPPYLYAYVWGHRYDLRNDLLATVDEGTVLGEIGPGGSSLIIVQQPVAKCLTGGVEAYLPQAREQVLAFFDHHARMAEVWDPIVRRHIEG